MTGPPVPQPARLGQGSGLRGLPGRTPLRVKLVAALLLLVLVALVAAGAAATTALRGILLQGVDDQLTHAAPAVARDSDGDGRGPGSEEYYRTYLDPAGTVVERIPARYATAEPPPDVPPLTAIQVAARDRRPFTVPATSGSGRWRAVALTVPDGTAVVSVSLANVQRTVSRLAFLQVGIGAVVLLLLAGAGLLLVRRSLRPLTEVEHTAAAIAAGDLSRRVPPADPRTEVGGLSAALNSMLGQIEHAFGVQRQSEAAARRSEAQMRQFVADASHELRTPLTSIRGFAELYRQGAAGDPADLARVMRRIEDEAARMGLLVEDLLLLARLDNRRPLERSLVDLLMLAADAVHDGRAVAPDRQITLEVLDGAAAPVVTGDEARLRQVLGNLVSNALHHTPPATPVTVRVGTVPGPDGRWALLEVADRGPGLGAEEAQRVFERFYRTDQSRQRGSGGTGLGLSIAAGLTAAHGGRMELDTEPGAGATFRVLLPLAADAAGNGPAGNGAAGGSAADVAGASRTALPSTP